MNGLQDGGLKSHVFCATELGHAVVAGFIILLLGKDLAPEGHERSPEGNEPLHDGGEQAFLLWLGCLGFLRRLLARKRRGALAKQELAGEVWSLEC